MKHVNHYLFISILFLSIYAREEKLFYTTVNLTEPVITALVESRAFQRLQYVHQYGIDPLVSPTRKHSACYNRYNHSIGVYCLAQHYGAPLDEQIAALLHDASHTAFSHVGDRIFKHRDGKCSYQDDHHLEFLSETDIPEILKHYGLTLEDINHKNPAFTCLEQPLPDICADRLEYNLAGGVLEGLITVDDAAQILDHLKFENNRWYFTDGYWAEKFARIPLWHTEHVWGSQMERYEAEELAQAIREALELDILTLEEIKHGTDDAIWQKLLSCNNARINEHIHNITHAYEHEAEISATPRNNKFRGIDPWICVDNDFKRLTELSPKFKQEYERVKAESYCS